MRYLNWILLTVVVFLLAFIIVGDSRKISPLYGEDNKVVAAVSLENYSVMLRFWSDGKVEVAKVSFIGPVSFGKLSVLKWQVASPQRQ